MHDITHFMHSQDGRQYLDGIRQYLEGRRITRVTFAASCEGIATTLHLDDNDDYTFTEDELSAPTLYEQFSGFFRDLHTKRHKRNRGKET